MSHLPLIVLFMLLTSCIAAVEPVVTERVPGGGLQPQVVIDGSGTIHAVWFSGPPAGGNLFYAKRTTGAATFGPALQVNSQDGAAVAMGTIRGAHLALGKGGRVHVLWNGSGTATPKGPDGGPGMMYARLDAAGTAFEAQRQLIQRAGGIDGGGAIVADGAGKVWAFWHAMAGAKTETGRAVYLTCSTDDGATFTGEQPATTTTTGACGCCGMQAGIDGQGSLYVLYRSAQTLSQRDEILLSRGKDQKTFTGQVLDPWKSQACPMSTSAIAGAGERTLLAWETNGRIVFTSGTAGKPAALIPVAAAAMGSKHPSVAVNAAGETLVAWTEGTGWSKGGSVAWQRFDAAGKPVGRTGRADGLPAWGLAAVVAKADGTFFILY